MAEQDAHQKIPLTIYLSADVAARLKTASETQRRSASDLAADLLDRYLPRSGPKQGVIPYA